MTETIDKLVYAIDGDIAPIKGKFAEVDSEAQKTGRKLSESISKPLQDAAAKTTASATQIKGALGAGTDAAGKQAAAIDGLRAKYDTTFAAQQKFTKTQAELNTLVAAGAITQQNAANILKSMAEHVGHTGGATATATREFRALFDEISSGRTRQSPGTLAIIATRVFGISGATLAWGAALAAIPAALAIAAYQSESAFARIQRQLEATGFAAGVTRNQLLGVAIAADQATGLSQRGASDIASALVSRGNVGAAQLPGATNAAFGLSRAAGISEDKAAEELEKILTDPVKGAQELDAQFKLLSVAEQEQIKTLVASGDTAKAQEIIIAAVNDRFGSLEASSWSLARGFDEFGKKLSDFWTHTGNYFTGNGQTDEQQLRVMAAQVADARRVRAGGQTDMTVPYYDADTIEKQYADLQRKHAMDNQRAAGGAYFKAQQDAVGYGVKLNQQYDDQGRKVKDLTEQQAALNKALGYAIGPDVQFQDGIKKTGDAVATALDALKLYGGPEKEAARKLADAAQIAHTPRAQQDIVRDQLQAQERYRQNLMNPATALQAGAILKSDLAAAQFNRQDVNKAAEQAQALKVMQEEANAAEAVAKAYDMGTAAAERAKIEGEAHTAFLRRQIANEDAYASALQKRAFWQTAATTASSIESMNLSNAGLAGVVSAGGNPSAVAAARRTAEAQQQTAGEFAAAGTMAQHMRAYSDYKRILSQMEERDQQNAIIGAQGQLYTSQSQYQMQGQRAAAVAAGASPDDLRHLDVAQQTFEQLIREGLDPTTDAFKKMFDQMVPLAESASDLADSLAKAQKEASDLASGITGPVKGYLTGKTSALDTAANIGQNEADVLIQNQIIDPLQKKLTSLFGDLLGVPGISADGTMTSPYYVIPLGAGGMPAIGGGGIPGLGGGGLGGGGLGGGSPFSSIFGAGGPGQSSIFGSIGESLFGNAAGIGGLFGSSPAMLGGYSADAMGAGSLAGLDLSLPDLGALGGMGGEAAAGGGIMDSLMSLFEIAGPFLGLFDEGGTIGPGQWGIKSGIPEIIQGGMGGVSVAPLNAPRVMAALGVPPNSSGPNGGMGGAAANITRGGDTHHWHLPGVTDTASFLRSRSQMENMVTKATQRGRRNS